MATGQVIPGVSNNELIRTTWGNFVANELNVNSVKLNGMVPGPAGPSTVPQVITAPLFIDASPTLRLRQSANLPIIYFEQHLTGTPPGAPTRYAYLQGGTAGLVVAADVGTTRFLVGGVEVVELASGLLKATGAGRFGNTTGNQVQVLDTNGGGAAALACVGFYPAATNIDTPGTRGGYVGFNGAGVELAGNGFNVNVESTTGTATLAGHTSAIVDGTTDIRFNTGGTFRGMMTSNTFLWSKSASDFANAGVEILGVGSTEGTIFTTIDDAGTRNLYCRHEGAANADTKQFISFHAGATQVGRIEQTGTSGISLLDGSDYRLKTVVGPIGDAVDRVKALNPLRVTWIDDAARGETDAFIAHEVSPVVPDAVSGVKDAVDGDGVPVMQGLDYSKLVTVTVAALQDLIGQVEALSARVAELEAAP